MSSPANDCPFCLIAAGDEPARIVYATDETVVFIPDDPATLGHTLVIPRKHIATVWDLDPATANAVTETTLKVAHAVREAMKPEGLNIIQSNGEAATQSVFHLHVHVLPRYGNDDIGPNWPNNGGLSKSEVGEARERIAASLKEDR